MAEEGTLQCLKGMNRPMPVTATLAGKEETVASTGEKPVETSLAPSQLLAASGKEMALCSISKPRQRALNAGCPGFKFDLKLSLYSLGNLLSIAASASLAVKQ